MYPVQNQVKKRLAQGDAVHGLFVQMNCPEIVEIAGSVGYDFVVIDCEHGSLDHTTMIPMIRAAEAVGVTAFVRVPNHDASFIGRVVEAGAMGLYVPNVSTSDEMRRIVAAVKYQDGANGGMKGACPGIRAAGHQADDWPGYVRWSNDNVVVVPLIETLEGVANLEEIVSVPGVDWVAIGMFDLSHALGHGGRRNAPELDELYRSVTARLRAVGMSFSRYPMPLEGGRSSTFEDGAADAFRQEKSTWSELGARIFMMGSDRGLIKQALRQRLAPMLAP